MIKTGFTLSARACRSTVPVCTQTSLHAVNDHEGTVRQPQGCSYYKSKAQRSYRWQILGGIIIGGGERTFGREVDVTRGIDEIEEEAVAFGIGRDVFLFHFEVQGQTGRLDGDTTLQLILSDTVSEPFLVGDSCAQRPVKKVWCGWDRIREKKRRHKDRAGHKPARRTRESVSVDFP